MRVVPAPPGLAKKYQARATAKGARLERLARDLFEARGCLVERAPQVVVWRPPADDTLGAPDRPRSVRHDFFGVWDLVIIEPVGSALAGRVRFAQVTTPTNLSHRRAKILRSDWPAQARAADDLVLVYAGRGRFRVWPGPRFDREAEPLQVTRRARRGRKEASHPAQKPIEA